jgi:hypothetical protein
MSRSRRIRREEKSLAMKEVKAAAKQEKVALKGDSMSAQSPISRAHLWLIAAFLLPNLGALACGFVYDDFFLILNNDSVQICSLRQFAHIWMSGNWPDPGVLQHYRPISEMLWAIIWAMGGGTHPVMFHAVSLALGTVVVLLFYRFLLTVEMSPRIAFIAAFLFAFFPIHTADTTALEGSPELLAAALGLGALILYYKHRSIPALILFALAVFSKESAAAFAAVPLAFPCARWRSRDSLLLAVGAGITIVAALLAHHAISHGQVGSIARAISTSRLSTQTST